MAFVDQQLVPVTLKGLSQKSPSNLSMPGELTDAVNVQVLKGGENGIELSKRYGTAPLPTTTDSINATVAAPRSIATLGSSLVLSNNQAIFSFDVSQNRWLARDGGGFVWGAARAIVSESLYQKVSPAHAIDPTTGCEIVAWYDAIDGVKFTVYGTTGDVGVFERSAGMAAFSIAYKVQVFAPGDGFFYILGPTSGTLALQITRVNVLAPRDPLTVIPLGGTDAVGTPFDGQLTPEGNILIAVRLASSTNIVLWLFDKTVQNITLTGSVGTAVSCQQASFLTQNPFGVGALRRYYLATTDATNGTVLYVFDGTLSPVSNNVVDATHLFGNVVGYNDPTLGPQVFVDNRVTSFFYLYSGGFIFERGVIFASRAFLNNGTWYALVRFDSPVQPNLFLMELGTTRIVAKINIGVGQWSSYLPVYGTLPWVSQSGQLAKIPLMAGHTALGQTASVPLGTTIQGISLATFNAAPALSKPVELGGVLFYPGGIPWIFDGANAVESGFSLYPDALGVADSGSGTSKVSAATYAYRATYVWRDAAGNVYESVPSPTFTFTTSNAHDLNVIVPTYRQTTRADVFINVYRDDPTQPSVFRLVNALPVPNNTGADTVTVLDSLNDLAVNPTLPDWSTRALLYNGDGGASADQVALEHVPPPACTIAWTAQNRIFLAGIDQDPSAVWFSNQANPKEGISFFDGFLFRVQGTVTAGVGRDRNSVVFTSEPAIWTATGEFPDATGGGAQIPTPFKLPHQLGAVAPQSIVTTSIGIFFQSTKGIHLLDWGWGATYIGKDAEDVLGTAAIVGGLEVPSLHQVRLYTSAGVTLVWDTVFNLWTSFDGQPATSACNWLGQPCYARADGSVWYETPGVYGDNGAWIQSLIGLAIHSPAGLRGYFCLFALQLLGEVKGAHTLNASLGYDGQDFVTTQYSFAVTGQTHWGDGNWGDGVWGGAVDNVLKPEIRPKKRQSSSYQLQIWDASLSSGATQGFTLQAVVAAIGVERNLGRVPNSGRMTKT